MSESEQVVRDFCMAWERRDIDELVGFFAKDGIYHNMPMEPAKGHDAIRGVMNMFVPLSKEISFEITNMASVGDVVFTERVDRFVMEGGTIEIPVAGVFEIEEGKIRAWRDYFDMQTFMNQMPSAGSA